MCHHAGSSQSILLLVSGPAGSGKTTLCDGLLKKYDSANPHTLTRGLKRVITATTRRPRENEKEGVDYFFLSEDEFRRRIEAREFYEWAVVYKHLYGTLKSEITRGLESGLDLLLNIDVQGAETLRKAAREEPALAGRLVTVFTAPATTKELEKRLVDRAQDSEEDIRHRLATAGREMRYSCEYDYCIPSQSREEDLRALDAVFIAEKLKVRP